MGWFAQWGLGRVRGLGGAGRYCGAGNTTISKNRAIQELGAGVWGRSVSTYGFIASRVHFTVRVATTRAHRTKVLTPGEGWRGTIDEMNGDSLDDDDWDDPRWPLVIWAACIFSETEQLRREELDWATLPAPENAVRMLAAVYRQLTTVVEPLDEDAWRREPAEFPEGQAQARKAVDYIVSDLHRLLDEDNLDAFATMALDDFKRHFEPQLLQAYTVVFRLARHIEQNVPMLVLPPEERAGAW